MKGSTSARRALGRVGAICLVFGASGVGLDAQQPCPILETPELESPRTSTPWPVTMSLTAYPPGDKRASRSDSARVELVVAADSSVPRCSIRILSITDATLSDIVIDAVSKARWEPGRRDGRLVASRVRSTEYFFSPDEAAALTGQSLDSVSADEPPQLLSGEEPEYPQALLERRRPGRVLAAFRIRPDGRVDMKSVKILETNDALFGSAVRRALVTFRYSPPMRQGTAIPTSFTMQQVFQFQPPR